MGPFSPHSGRADVRRGIGWPKTEQLKGIAASPSYFPFFFPSLRAGEEGLGKGGAHAMLQWAQFP